MNESMYTSLASVYDELMYDIDYDSWADYLAMLLTEGGIPQNAKLLEAACGTGNLSCRLAKKGFSLLSSDLSEEMLEIASQKAREYGVDILFTEADMRSLSTQKKDAVLACCDAVNYLTEKQDVLSFFTSAYRCLKPGGLLLFDISSQGKLLQMAEDQFFFEDFDDLTYFWQNEFDKTSGCVKMEITLFSKEKNGLYTRNDELHVQKAHTIKELLALLKEAGFSNLRAYCFSTKQPATDADPRIQFFAVKPD